MSVVKQQDESATAPVSVTGFDHEKEVNLMRALKVVSDNLPEVKEWLLNTNVKVERKRALAFHLRTIQRFVQKIKEMNEICGPIEAKGISSVAADIDPEDVWVTVELDGKLPVVYSVGIGTTYKQLCQNLGLTMNSHVLVVTRAMRSHFLQLADHPLEKGNQYRLITFTPKKLDTKK